MLPITKLSKMARKDPELYREYMRRQVLLSMFWKMIDSNPGEFYKVTRVVRSTLDQSQEEELVLQG